MLDPIRFPRFDALMIPIALIAVLTFHAGSARAAERGATWVCAYDRDVSIACKLDKDAGAATLDATDFGGGLSAGGVAPAPGRRGQLPAIVRTLRESPGSLAGRTVLIPLHTEATDMAFVRQLADAVMCGGQPGCRVEFAPGRTELAQMSPQDLVDVTDAALED